MTRRHRLRAEDFARRLIEARERAGLTQLGLARRCGYETGQAISEIERETIGVTIVRCAEIARALGVSAPWLAFGVDSAQRSGAPFVDSAQRSGAPFVEEGPPATGEEAKGYGVRLKQARVAAKASQAWLAEQLGYANKSPIYKLESEIVGMEIGQAERIAQALQVTPQWLAYGVES